VHAEMQIHKTNKKSMPITNILQYCLSYQFCTHPVSSGLVVVGTSNSLLGITPEKAPAPVAAEAGGSSLSWDPLSPQLRRTLSAFRW